MQWINLDWNPGGRRAPTKCAAMSLLAILCLPAGAHAQVGGAYDLSWSTIDGGGGTSMGTNYRLFGTVGQPDAGEAAGGRYELGGGFGSGSTQGTTGTLDPPAAAAPPAIFQLRSIHPNPFTHQTTIAFDLPVAAPVVLNVYSAAGKHVRRLLAETRPAGRHAVIWSASNDGERLARGVYIVRLHAAGATAARKVVLYH